ncbi:uncharacterized protein K460DRAFT_427813 [Cucurbitaria berberidis CBS 394.84]|uniref:Uncharacterized protein n=1 Tax=Cucurbitaria berberidis CBS 394.84 TaxID=1168544 RepID=A0A9P4GN49_9PLEO|nr:uncharacterized protein K460DRAFT_427813 [Cucurbitaria berberidis CBS 394.84]KAF1848625.1 hypothetical protein K460DRAFT_427813 [Cucurbitaria berberidis CBS 394.84]
MHDSQTPNAHTLTPIALKAMETPEPRCLLFELPRELRDLIYEYALTEVGGLVINGIPTSRLAGGSGYFHAGDNKGAKHDANQLKFVCRLLHSETAGLGLRYNDVTFHGTRHKTGVALFQQFVFYECSKMHLQRIKKVTITYRHVSWAHKYRGPRLETVTKQLGLTRLCTDQFAAYCQANPATEINIRVGKVSHKVSWGDWVVFVMLLHHAHGVTASVDTGPKGPGGIPRNVRIFPASFDEEYYGILKTRSTSTSASGPE